MMARPVRALGFFVAVVSVAGGGCIGGRFAAPRAPDAALDAPTQGVVDSVVMARRARGAPKPAWVADLRLPAARAAAAVARGELALTGAAHMAAQAGVTAVGRHVWSFVTDCADPRQFHPPNLALEQPTLLFGAAAVPGGQGHTYVVLLIADPGPSALRADQMGGGRGGSNPTLETYAHPSVATGPCGQTWPAPPHLPL